ncbi:MAG: serine/threonine-protein kinase [Myxococcota bacterium]
MDDIEEAATLRAEEGVADSVGRALGPEDDVGRGEHPVDRMRPDQADPASEDSASVGTGTHRQKVAPAAPLLDSPVFAAEQARVFEALFQVPAEPQRLGRYVVLGTLGKGGMGTVLEAFDRTLDRKVAVKVLHQELDDKHTARLLREAQAMAKLSHPNVVPVFDADTVGGQTFVAMELVQGQTLRHWMRQDPPPDWRQCVKVFIEAGQGLSAAHAQGLIHRDFKPGNAIVDDKGRTRVLDFGLARRTEVDPTEDEGLDPTGDQTNSDPPVGTPAPEHTTSRKIRARGIDKPALDLALTRTGAVVGTPAYMPPEQMRGQIADARSDQFSFCVALYEAVYGERPFEGRSVPALVAAVTRGEVRPAPKGSPVPARLRTVLLRGLAVEPAKRWPSMEALLTQLRTLVAPRNRRWMALGVTTGLAAMGVGLAMPRVLEMQERCTGAPAQMNGIWDDARRQQVQAALLGTEVSFALSTWDRIEPQLDAYVQAWMDTHAETCEATRIRGDQTPEEMSLRMRCLYRRRTALRATVDVLTDADAQVVTRAVGLVAGLPPLNRCDDLVWLEQQNQRVPPPEDPDVAAAVQAERARLADIAAMDKTGRYKEALDAVEPMVEQAEALGYPPLRAEALYWRGHLEERTGQYAKAEPDLRQAHRLAVEHHHDRVALHTAQALTFLVAHRLARHAEALQWGQMVALPLAQGSDDPVEEAKSLGILGIVFDSQGDYNNARVYDEQALAIQQKALGPNHPHVAVSLNNLGTVFARQGDLHSAQVHYQRALAIRETVLGPDHPRVAATLLNLGAVLEQQGDYDNARMHDQRALAVAKKALGTNHPFVAKSLYNLGNVFKQQGELDKARVHYQQSLTIWENVLDPDHPNVARSLHELGTVFARQGHQHNARVYYQRALTIREKSLGPDHPDVTHSLLGLAQVMLDEGNPTTARAHAERAVSIREAATVAPQLIAEARFVLARALWNMGSERAPARALAEQARDALAANESPGESVIDLAMVDAWLATHRERDTR